MSEKVYGISGKNKGRKEVIEKDNIVVIEEIVPPVTGSMAATRISLPDGVTMSNSILLSIVFMDELGAINIPCQFKNENLEIKFYDSLIQIKMRADSTILHRVRIALLKI